ncbi:MAG: LAGLIDADG family homing endonuclease [Candidatus Aenigmatarchaeota archaeon]
MGRRWNKTEINLLVKYAKERLSNEEIARRLNRSKDSIEWKLYKNLKIRKNDLRLPKFERNKLYELYYKKGLSLQEIAKVFGCSTTYIFKQMKKFQIPRDRNRYRKTPLEIPNKNYKTLTPAKAYILGVLCGDGMLYRKLIKYKGYKYFNYFLGLRVTDKEFADEFKNKIKNVYGIIAKKCNIPPGIRITPSGLSKCKRQYIVYLQRKKVYEDLKRYGEFNSYVWRVPQEIIKNNDKLIISSFLKGFFDSEGSVDISNRAIEATSSNKNGLEDIRFLLSKFGIFTKIELAKKGRKLYKIRFSFSNYLEIFRKEIGFTIKRKEYALDKIIKNKKKYRYSAEDYWNVLRLRVKNYTSNQISIITGFPRSTIKSWFKKPAYIAIQSVKLNLLPKDWDLLTQRFPFLKEITC